MLLLFQNKDSHTSFQDCYALNPLPRSGSWFPALDGTFAIIVAHKYAQKETSEFLRQASKEIMTLVRPLNLTLTIPSDTDLSRSSADFQQKR